MDDEPTPSDPSVDPERDLAEDALGSVAEARRRLGEVPAETIVVNHVVGLYELGAIHLSADPPRLAEAALAIDAVGCLVEGLGQRLGEEHDTLVAALQNIRLAFVQIKDSRPDTDG